MITNLITFNSTTLQMETSEGILLKGKFSYQGLSGNTPWHFLPFMDMSEEKTEAAVASWRTER